MIKPVLISLGVLILCGLENIGHYFGFCFHGWMSTVIGCLGVFGLSFSLYLKQFQAWLTDRNSKQPQHTCKDHNHEEVIHGVQTQNTDWEH